MLLNYEFESHVEAIINMTNNINLQVDNITTRENKWHVKEMNQ